MSTRMIQLITSDDEKYEVARDVIKQSSTVNTLITDLGMDDDDSETSIPIPLPKVESGSLKLVLQWCEYHKADEPVKEDEEIIKSDLKVPAWDQEFFKSMPNNTLFFLVIAANYLDIKMLLEYCCKTISERMRGKRAEEIRTMFGIVNDFSKEEEEAIRKENMWCENN